MSHPNSGFRRNILVVDDEPEIVACVCEFLTGRGFNVLGLSNSLEAASRLGSFRPDVCILDFRMPERSGAELLETIKQYDFRIEVIFLTAQNEASVAVDLMRKGALDFLLKPLGLNQLLLFIKRPLEHRRLFIGNEKYRFHIQQHVHEKTKERHPA